MNQKLSDWIIPLIVLSGLAFATFILSQMVLSLPVTTTAVSESGQTQVRTDATAVSPATPAPTTTPQPTAVPQGQSRTNPLPNNGTISLPNWDVRVLDLIRGDQAAQQILDEFPSNDPPPTGWEYILIRYHIRSKIDSDEEELLGLHLTGNANTLYYSFNNSLIPIDPILSNSMRGGEENEGWEAYIVRQGESDLLLVLDDLSDYTEPHYFVALENGTSISVPDNKLNDIQITQQGIRANEPTAFGIMTTSENWQVQILEQIRGEEALATLLAVNQFNDPPPKGMEYVMVKIWVRYIGLKPNGEDINNLAFDILGNSKTVYERVSAVNPFPNFPSLYLYPDGVYEGWVSYFIAQDETNLTLIFQPGFGSDEADLRYLSLQANGR